MMRGLLSLLLVASTAGIYTGPSHSSNWRTRRNRRRLIYGGGDAPPNAYPFFVQWGDGNCGATLLWKDLVLTAGHCRAALGLNIPLWVGGDGTMHSGTYMNADESWYHYDYVPGMPYEINDFAILRLPAPVDGVTPVVLNTNPAYPEDGQDLIIIGYGRTDPNSANKPGTLQQGTMQFMKACNDVTPDGVRFCAYAGSGSPTVCAGDSGGPIVDANGVQIGVTSYGFVCGDPVPAIFGTVSYVALWLEHMKCQVSRHPPTHCSTLTVELTVYDIALDSIEYSVYNPQYYQMFRQTRATWPLQDAQPNQPVTFTHQVPPGQYVVFVSNSDVWSGQVVITDGASGMVYTQTMDNARFFSFDVLLEGNIDTKLTEDLTTTTEAPTSADTTWLETQNVTEVMNTTDAFGNNTNMTWMDTFGNNTNMTWMDDYGNNTNTTWMETPNGTAIQK